MNEPCLDNCRLGQGVILKVKTFSVSAEGHRVSRADKALTIPAADGLGTSFLIIISGTGGRNRSCYYCWPVYQRRPA